jgi:hypothetical protein
LDRQTKIKNEKERILVLQKKLGQTDKDREWKRKNSCASKKDLDRQTKIEK